MRGGRLGANVAGVVRRFNRAHVVDATIAALLVAAAQFHVWTGAAAGAKAVTAPAGFAIGAAVALRRRAPLAAVLVAMAATVVQTAFASSPQALWLIACWVILLFSAGRALRTEPALLALAVGIVGAAVDESRAADRSISGFAFALGALIAVPWLAGRAVGVHEGRAATLEREGAKTTRRALEAERARIARDLHDIVAHAVSLMVLKAEAGEAVLEADPARTREQLSSIQETGRQALGEMTRLLGMLRTKEPDGLTAQPRVAQLPSLIEGVRRAGLDVALRVDGDARALEPGVDLTVYRIVQEALTNALKHGRRGGRAEVVLRYVPSAISIEVLNDGSGSRNGGRGGHGLLGMRERVSLYGGTVQAGPTDEDRFAVTAMVPT
jgi:signal transduction histidine kinase